MAIIVFEGPDRSGKTTMLKLFRMCSDYKHVLFDRFVGSAYVYDKLYNRKPIAEYFKLESYLSRMPGMDVILVVCVASAKELQRRSQLTGEMLSLKELDRARELFIDYATNKTGFKYRLIIDTTRSEMDTYVADLVKFVKGVQDEKLDKKSGARLSEHVLRI